MIIETVSSYQGGQGDVNFSSQGKHREFAKISKM